MFMKKKPPHECIQTIEDLEIWSNQSNNEAQIWALFLSYSITSLFFSKQLLWWSVEHESARFGIAVMTHGAKVCRSLYAPLPTLSSDLYICSEFTTCEILSVNNTEEDTAGGKQHNRVWNEGPEETQKVLKM